MRASRALSRSGGARASAQRVGHPRAHIWLPRRSRSCSRGPRTQPRYSRRCRSSLTRVCWSPCSCPSTSGGCQVHACVLKQQRRHTTLQQCPLNAWPARSRFQLQEDPVAVLERDPNIVQRAQDVDQPFEQVRVRKQLRAAAGGQAAGQTARWPGCAAPGVLGLQRAGVRQRQPPSVFLCTSERALAAECTQLLMGAVLLASWPCSATHSQTCAAAGVCQ